MSVLKNKTTMENNTVVGLETLLESQIKDFNALCMETMIDFEEEYFLIMESFNDDMNAGQMYNSEDILEEGLRDFGSNVSRYFKMMIEKLGQIYHTLKKIIDNQIMSTNAFCKKYEKDIKEMTLEPFRITGFKYNIKDGVPNLGLINELVSNYNSHLDGDLKAITNRSFDMGEFKSKMSSDDALDKLRGRILGKPQVESQFFDEDCIEIFKGSLESVDFDVDKQMVLSIINHSRDNNHLLNSIARDYDSARRALHYLSNFFESPRVVRIINDTEKLSASKLEISDRRTVRSNQEYSGAPIRSITEVNEYFSVLFARTKALSNAMTSCLLIKSQACKDLIRQNKMILENALKHRPKPIMNTSQEAKPESRDIKKELDNDLDEGIEESMLIIDTEDDAMYSRSFDHICLESIMSLSEECIDILNVDEVLLEADMRTGKHKQSRINIIKILEGFFIRIQEMFGEFIAKYGTNHKRLINNAKTNMNAINFDKLAVTADKTFLANENKVFEVRNTNIYRSLLDPSKITRAIERMKVEDKGGESEASTKQRFLESEICKGFISKDGSLSEGCKNYFKYGQADHRQSIKTVFKGNELQNLIGSCIGYCEKYPQMQNELKAIKDTAQRSIANINRQFGIFAEESILDGEGDILLEADMKMDNKAPGVQSNPNQDKSNQTDSPVDIPKQNERDNSVIDNNIENNTDKYELRVMKYVAQALQILVTSTMNVAQERYLTYIRMIQYCARSLKVDKFTGAAKKEKDNPNDMVSSNPDKTANNVKNSMSDKIKEKIKR